MSGTQLSEPGIASRDLQDGRLDTSTSLAVAAVQLALACSDHVLARVEVDEIAQFCAHAFSLGTEQQMDLLRAARHLVEESETVGDACRLICSELSAAQRQAIAEQLQNIIRVDGRVTEPERQLYRRILSHLDVAAPGTRRASG